MSDAFHRRLGFGERPALVVVDMCRAYFSPSSPLDLDDRTSLDGCVALVDAARSAAIPIFWTRVEFEPGGAGSVFYRKVGALSSFDLGNPLGGWLPELTPAEGEPVITKQGASSFFGTDLAHQLDDLDIDTVVIGGVSTSGCVRATAVDACQHDLVPIVVREACGDRTEETQRNALFDLDAKYADVVSLTEAVDALLRER